MQTLVYLQNDVDAFRVNDMQLSLLKKYCSDMNFVQAKTDAQVEQFLPDSDLFITWHFKAQWYPVAKKLKAIFTPAAGQEWIDTDNCYTIPIFHGTFHGAIMAQSLLAMILHFNRRLGELHENQLKKRFDRNLLSPTPTLQSQQVLIIGYGKIGIECARILNAFNCKITGVRRTHLLNDESNYATLLIHPDQLLEYLGEADHVITVLPKNSSTNGLLTPQHFMAMKNSAYFYNIGRGNCYKEETLVTALENGHVAGAGLDVFEIEPLPSQSKLWNMPNVLIMPHGSAICKDYLNVYFKELTPKLRAFVVG